jgi:DNA-binding LytR/AlgR family response regulator
MPRAIIADDEDLALLELKQLLAVAWPSLEVVAECTDGGEAIEAIVKHEPDIAFLDIRMPALSGLDVARITAGKCRIIFTTAFDSFAIEAFNLGAIDYLLKPIKASRLEQTIVRLREQFENNSALPQSDILRMMIELEERLKESKAKEQIRWISASIGKTIKIIRVEEVLFFEADARYIRVVTEKDDAIIRTPLKELQLSLDSEQFWQISRSVIVNVNALDKATRDELGNIMISLRKRSEIFKVSPSYVWRFKGM